MKNKTKICFIILLMALGLLFCMSSKCFAVEEVADWGGTGYTVIFGTNDTPDITIDSLYDYNYVLINKNSELILYTSKDILYCDNYDLFSDIASTGSVQTGYQRQYSSTDYILDDENKVITLNTYSVSKDNRPYRPCYNAAMGQVNLRFYRSYYSK